MTQQLFTLADACIILGVKPYVVTYLLATKKLPEPQRIGGRRMFTDEDLSKLSAVLKLDAYPRLPKTAERGRRAK
jgi:hypothetical protein